MNAERRRTIQKQIDLLANAKAELEAVRDDEEAAFEGLPENFQMGERGDAMQEAIQSLETAIDQIDEVISAAEEAQG